MKKIYVIHTGGTIGMEKKQSGGIELQTNHPLSYLPIQEKIPVEIIHHQLFHIPSPHMTPEKMLELRNHILEKMEAYDGFVITHGTDTLEETAYFLKLTLFTKKPVILTGSMRPSNDTGSDALYNFCNAIRAAVSDLQTLCDVFVVMNDEIHNPAYVTKTHTTHIGTFQSPSSGPVGILTKDKISLFHQLLSTEKYNISSLSKEVVLLKVYTDMREDLLETLLKTQIDGLVLEAFGQGNVPPTIVPTLDKFLEKNIPILLVSRCFQGVVEGSYDYAGGGKQLKERGIIFSNGLNGQKARLKLSILLSCHTPYETLQQHFM